MQVIDLINGSALFAQSAYSASIATKDNLGRDITATYLTGVSIPESATWNDVSTTVQTNSAQWAQGGGGGDEEVNSFVYNNSATINEVNTSYQTNSGTFLTAVDLTPYQTIEGMTAYYTTADANTLSSMLSGAIDYVSANAGDEFPVSADEAIQYVQTNSGTIDDTVTSYQTNSGTFLTAHQAISAEEWNSNYETVNTNSGAWGGDALPISAGPGIMVNLVDNTLVFSNDETLLWSGSPTTFTTAFTASESISNFDKIKVSQIIYTDNEYIQENHEYESDAALLTNEINVGFNYVIDNGWKCWGAEKYHITNGTDFTMYRAGRNFIGPETTAGAGYNDTIQSANGWIYKVVGINRK